MRASAITMMTSVWILTGCTSNSVPMPKANNPSKPVTKAAEKSADIELAAERAKLSAEDRALVEAQEWCVVSTDEKLGSMGAPIKLTIKDQPVFICCGGCKKKAEADPDKTLAKLEELKAKKKAASQSK